MNYVFDLRVAYPVHFHYNIMWCFLKRALSVYNDHPGLNQTNIFDAVSSKKMCVFCIFYDRNNNKSALIQVIFPSLSPKIVIEFICRDLKIGIHLSIYAK